MAAARSGAAGPARAARADRARRASLEGTDPAVRRGHARIGARPDQNNPNCRPSPGRRNGLGPAGTSP